MICVRASLLLALATAGMISLPGQAQIRPAPSAVPQPQSAPAPVPAPKSALPPSVTFIARIIGPSRTVPSRLGGWACTTVDCRLRTSGPATQVRMRDLCLGLQGLAKERSIKFTVEKLLALDQRGAESALLSSGYLAACNRR